MSQLTKTNHARIPHPIESARRLTSVEGQTLLQMTSGRDQLAQVIQACAHRKMGHCEACSVSGGLGYVQKFLRQFTGSPKLPPLLIKRIQAPHYGEESPRVTQLFAQCLRTSISVFCL